jgi:peptide/nickel transport system substrate-binding protein
MSGSAIGTIDPDLGFVSLQCNTYYKDGKGTNFANYCNPTVDSLFITARQTSDQSKRAPQYIQATKIVNDELPYLILYVPKTLYATTNRLKAFKPNPEIAHTFWNAGDWYVTTK